MLNIAGLPFSFVLANHIGQTCKPVFKNGLTTVLKGKVCWK